MKRLELTLDTPAENLALDEALLEVAETTADHPEVLRIWEPRQTMVVLGRSSPLTSEVNTEFCTRHSIPIFRRCSGGQTIVTGPGCLMYAVLLDYRNRPQLKMLEKAHRFVMSQIAGAVEAIGEPVRQQGTSDLTLAERKFSGNSLRCKKNWMIYHGTLLCNFDIDLIASCLGTPIREPDYRRGRSHQDFLTQLPLTISELANALIHQWNANDLLASWPVEKTNQLAAEKYSNPSWTKKR